MVKSIKLKHNGGKTKKNNTGLNKIYKFKKQLGNITKTQSGTRKDAVKSIWNHINKNKLKGNKIETLRHNGKLYKGGQVIMCKDKLMKDFSQNKTKIAMTQIAGLISKHIV